jgi:uncharacterized membrane protein YbhN (UPF0104 family)
MRFLAAAALALAGFLLYRTLRGYDLDQIVASVTSIPLDRLALAGGFAAASYLCLTGFDALAVRYVGRVLPYRSVALASFCSLSIGHNVGLAALSSGAIRYRFYSRWGMSAEQVAKLILFCAITVGLGLMILGGAALLLQPELAREITGLDQAVILGLGTTCLALAIGYLMLAAFVRRPLRLRNWSLQMPSLPLAIGQVVIGPLNFACVAACLYQALAAVADAAYLGVAAVYVIANVTALVTHVPGGLGVIEAVVLFLLPQGQIVGALVVFRFVYFFVPLAIGSLLLAAVELARRHQAPARDDGADCRAD